eukprot:403688_1
MEPVNRPLNVFSIHYLKSKSCVLIVPGGSKHMYLYHLSTKQCKHIPMRMHSYFRGSSILTRNEQYFIEIVVNISTSEIHVYDLKRYSKWISNICLPTNVKNCQAMIRSNIGKEEMLTFGYVRDCWNGSEFNNIQYPPLYLVKLIDSFHVIETVHIMTAERHFCINVDHIIAS